MHPTDCPEWDYAPHPQRAAILPNRIAETITALANGTLNTAAVTADTRPIHDYFFGELTPPDHRYFAGHYRGEEFRCLKFYEVMIQGDPSVGAPAARVRGRMT